MLDLNEVAEKKDMDVTNYARFFGALFTTIFDRKAELICCQFGGIPLGSQLSSILVYNSTSTKGSMQLSFFSY
jgi:hypothetical protein